MVSKALLTRLRSIESSNADGPLRVISIDAVPDAQQLEIIADAERTGRPLIVLILRGDTVWMPGTGPAPWLEPSDELTPST